MACKGLKIPRWLSNVPVRVRPSALDKNKKESSFNIRYGPYFLRVKTFPINLMRPN